jgi:hypothetical protein
MWEGKARPPLLFMRGAQDGRVSADGYPRAIQNVG